MWQFLRRYDLVANRNRGTPFAEDDGRIVSPPMDAETRDAIDAVRADLREVETRLRAEFRREIREEGITTRRHFDVVAESLRDDIRLIAEGLVALDAKVEGIRRV